MRLLFVFLLGLLAVPVMFASGAVAQDGYKLRPGDVVRIEVLEDPTLNRSALVPPDGRLSLPLAGSVGASGRTVEQVQSAISAALAPNFAAAPSVFVSIERLAEVRQATPAVAATITVFIMGEAANPGKLEIAPGTTMLQLFAQMGGFSNFAATKRIQLRRQEGASGAEKLYYFNYDAIESGTSQNGNVVVSDGDIILVPQRRLFE